MQWIFIIGAYTNQNVLNVHSDHSLKPAKMAAPASAGYVTLWTGTFSRNGHLFIQPIQCNLNVRSKRNKTPSHVVFLAQIMPGYVPILRKSSRAMSFCNVDFGDNQSFPVS